MNEEILDLLSQIQLHDNSTRSRQVVSFGSPSRSVLVASSPKVHKSPSEKGSFRTGSKATCTAVHEKNGLFGGINDCSQVATNTVGNEKRCFGLHNVNADQESIYWY